MPDLFFHSPLGDGSSRQLRARHADLAELADRAPQPGGGGTARRLVQIFDGGSMPSSPDHFFFSHPVELDGTETEGGAVRRRPTATRRSRWTCSARCRRSATSWSRSRPAGGGSRNGESEGAGQRCRVALAESREGSHDLMDEPDLSAGIGDPQILRLSFDLEDEGSVGGWLRRRNDLRAIVLGGSA